MITVQLTGGLGNQLFQYAMAKALSLEKKQKLSIDIASFKNYKLHNYGLNNFAITAKTYKHEPKIIKKLKNKLKLKTHYQEQDFGFNKNIFALKNYDIYLEGYFQSEKYFIKHQQSIRNDLEIISPLKPITNQLIPKITQVNSVSIHIRRGDYLLNELHNTNKQQYYLTAMAIIESKIDQPVYFVFSDDIDWAKTNFKTNFETIFVDFNNADTNFEDLKLMSSCQHNIIANSSFSWWGAWLNNFNDKIVIAPKIWFNDSTINTNDLIPENWTKI